MDVFLRHLRRGGCLHCRSRWAIASYVLALFPGGRFSREPLNIWNSQAQLLYTNWLNYYVYQTTPYDIERVGE